MAYPAPHCARVAILWTSAVDLQTAENTFYLQDTTDAMFADPGATVDAIWTAFIAHVPAATDPGVIYNGVVFEDVRTVPYGGIDVPETPHPGTLAYTGAGLPSDTCKAVKKSTGTLGRSGRGRWFFPILNSGALNTPDTFTSLVCTTISGALQGFQTALELAITPAKMGIVSFRHNNLPVNPGVFRQITGWGCVNTYVDTQRRRLLGHNRHR